MSVIKKIKLFCLKKQGSCFIAIIPQCMEAELLVGGWSGEGGCFEGMLPLGGELWVEENGSISE